MEKLKVALVIIIAFVIMWVGVIYFNHVSDDYANSNDKVTKEDLSDVSNVSIIDKNLGSDIKITQSYLMKYTTNKIGIWYLSHGTIKDVRKSDKSIVYSFTDKESNKTIFGSINGDTNDVYKKGDKVSFVGTINLTNGMLNLSMVDKNITLSTPVEMELVDLFEHINNVRETHFIIQGYIVTEGTQYKLFDSKSDFLENEDAGNYFLLQMHESFNYTGNASVTLDCQINGTYNLRNCKLVE